MKKGFLLVREYGRYNEETTKVRIDIKPIVKAVKTGIEIKATGSEDEWEEFMDLMDDGEHASFTRLILMEDTYAPYDKLDVDEMKERLRKLVDGERFYFNLEESTIAYGSSKEGCIAAFGEAIMEESMNAVGGKW